MPYYTSFWNPLQKYCLGFAHIVKWRSSFSFRGNISANAGLWINTRQTGWVTFLEKGLQVCVPLLIQVKPQNLVVCASLESDAPWEHRLRVRIMLYHRVHFHFHQGPNHEAPCWNEGAPWERGGGQGGGTWEDDRGSRRGFKCRSIVSVMTKIKILRTYYIIWDVL